MIPLSKITGKHSSGTQTKYNRRIPLSQIIGTTSAQEEPEKDSGEFWDTAKNLFNFTPAGVAYNVIDSPVPHFAGGLLAETAGNVSERLGKEFPETSWRRRALDTVSDFAQNVTDTALKNGQNQVEIGDDDTFTGAIGNRFVSSASGLLGNMASMIHADKTADAAIKASESTANKNRVSTDDLGEYLTNPRGFASDATEQLTSTAMIAPFMALLPEAAVARGVATFGGDAITQALINRGLYGAAKVFAGGAPRAVQYGLTSAPVEGAMEGGETRRNLLAQGASEEEATKESFITGLKNVPLLLATNTLEGLAFFSPLKGANKALQIVERAAANSAQQQYEEFAQEGIQNAALGKPYSWLPWRGAPNQYEAAERARYPALLMGGIGGAVQALGGRNENQANYERGSQENISVGDYSSRANESGRNLWTWASNISGGTMSEGVFDSIVRNAQELGIDPKLALALATAESNGNQDDISPVGAIGVMQLMPETAEGLGVDPYDQEQNIRGGMKYLRQMYDQFGDWNIALAAYNAGPGAVQRYGGIPPYSETQNYVARINGFMDEAPEYQGGEQALGNEGITYLGENGNAEGKYWIRNPNMNVSTEGMRPESLNALDVLGKFFFDHTGKPLILNSGTNGDHAAGEFSHANGWKFDIIDQLDGDGALITSDYGRGQFLDQFIKYGRSLGLGMNFEGEGTSNVHLDVAVDGTQWDGNGDHAGGFNLDRIRAVASSKSRSEQSPPEQTQQQNKTSQEKSKPLFDLNTQDSTTQKLLKQFANERFTKAVDDKDVETAIFFNGMFEDDSDKVSIFQNTPENRNAIINRYGDEFNEFVQKNSSDQAKTDSQQKSPEVKSKTKQEIPYDRDTAIIKKGQEYLDDLLKKNDETSKANSWTLNSAIRNNDVAAVENILKQNNVAIPEPKQTQPSQPQQDPVKENKPPENILPKKLQQQIKVASAPVKTGANGKKSRQRQGNAIIELAGQNKIEIPNPEVIALTKGSAKAVQKWRDNLMQAGVFNNPQQQETPPPQLTQKQKISLKERANQILKRAFQTARAGIYGEVQGNTNGASRNYSPTITQDYIDTPIIAQEDIERAKNIRNQRESDQAVTSRPSLKNFGRRAEIARDLREPYVADTGKTKKFDDIPAWRGRTREDNLTLRKDFRNVISNSKEARASERIKNLNAEEQGQAVRQNAIENDLEIFHVQTPQEIVAQREQERKVQEQQRRITERIQNLDTNEIGRKSGTKSPEQEIFHVQTPQEIKTEQEQERQRQHELRETYSDIDLGESQKNNYSVQNIAYEGNYYDDPESFIPPISIRDIQQAKRLQHQKEEERRAQSQPQKIAPQKNNDIRGNTAEVITGSRKPHQIQYRVVEAKDLNSSHVIDNGNVFANKNYPVELQPRDRSRVDMQAQLISMGNNLNPADLLDARDVNQGAPTTRSDGVVLNGNGRTAAIRYAYENGKGDLYKNALIQNAQRLGLNADEISKMNQPVLVRELKNDLSEEELKDIVTTQTGGARMGASEQAQSDATKLSTETLSLFPQDDNVDLTHASTNDFLRAALNDIATPDERNALTQSDGKINQDGINRVQRALFALAYGDNGLISRMSESTDDNVRGATNALLNAAPTIAKVQAAMENGTLHKYDLSAIADAVKKLSALRDEGKPVQKYLQEQSLFAEHADSAESKEILSFLDKSKHAPNKISTFLKKIASNIQSQGDPSQGNLFGLSDEPKPLMDIIKKARQDVENNGEQDLFAQEEKSEQKSETPKQESKPEESDEQKIDRRAEELLEEVATEGHLPLPKFDTKALAIEIGKNGKGQSAVHIAGKVPNRDAYKRLATELKYLSLKLGGHKDKNEIFDFKSEEDAKVFAKALEKYFALTTEEKQSRISAGKEKAKAQAEKNRADLEKRVSQISDEEKQAQAQRILNALDRGVLTLNEAISNVENIINPKKPNKRNKHSKQGKVDTRIDNFVDDKYLTPQQKLLQTFGEKLGVKVKFFDNEDGDFHGAHKSGTSYINVNSKMPIGKVFWHESMHWLKANNPKLYQSLVKAAGITDAQRQAYLEQTGRDDLETDEEIDEEIIADQFEDVAKRTGLLQSISGKNRSLIERVVQWLKDIMNKFIAHFKNPDGKLTTKQSIALADEFGRIAKDLVDPNGQKIFRYNRRTHNIELADGRDLSEEHLTDMAWMNQHFAPKYAFAGKKAKTADKESLKRAKQMEKRGVNRDEIYDATGWFKGKDNKWRFEIPDNFDKIDFDKLWRNEETQYRLDEIYDNPALFAAYPQLRKVLVRSKQLKSPESYGYTNGTEITLNWSKIDDEPEDAGKTLVHEIQHVVQDYEIFSSGGSDSNVLSTLKNNMAMIKDAVKAIPNGKKYFKAMIDARNAMESNDESALLKAFKAMNVATKDLSTKNRQKIEEYVDRFNELSDAVDEIRDAKGETMTVYTDDGEIEEPYDKYLKYEAYERLGGEQEARAVGERLFDRTETPVAHDDDALIIFGGNTYGMIKQSENKKRPSENGDGELVKDGAMREIFPPSAATANGTTKRQSPAKLKVTHDNKGGVGTSGNSVDTNSPNGTIPQGEEKIKYSFAGKKAKIADKDSLNQAMSMDASGLNRDQIYRETGWVKGKDNQWRFEIPDNLNKINLGKLVRDGKATVGGIYDNPKLYAAYPQLKNISVKTSDEMKSSGNFNPSKNTITLNKEVAEVLPDRAKQALVHELQHAIQKIEGFAFGSGESNSDYKNLGGEQEAREVAARADMSKDKLRATTPTIHDENAVIIFAGKKYTVNSNQHETPNDESSYSIDSNDNSSESLSQKIQNKFAAWWNGNPKKNRNKEITDLLYRTTGYKVDFGNVKDADQTIIDDVHKVIRAKHAYEWEKLLPQIGGKIAKTLKLNPTQEMSNYIADWCMTGAVGNRSAEAKAFEKAMHDDPITAGLMLQIRDAFQEFNDMSAQEKISDTIVSRLKGKSPKEIAKTLWGEKEEQITDDLHPVLRQVNEMITKAEKTSPTLANLMKEDINPYQMMRLLRGVGGLGDLILHANAQNIEDVRNQFRALYPSRKFDRLVSLDMIIDMAGGKNHDKGLIDFAVAKLDKEMHEKLRANPNEDIRPQFSEAVDDEIIKAGEKQYSEAHRALVTYSNILACIQYDAGLLTDSQFRKMMKGWKNYIPMIRVFDEEENFKFEDSLKHKTGSQRSTYNPLETLTQNTYDALSRAERNKAKQQLAFYARIGEFGDIIQEVETSNPGKNIIHYRENGEMKYLKVFDPAVKRAVDNIYTPADTSWIMKFLKATMSFVRSMRTLASTDFAIGNPFRDMQDAYIHNRHADANPFVAMLNVFREGFKGFGLSRMLKEKSLVPHDTDWVEFNALGGTQSTFVSEDVDQLRRSMNKLTRKTFKESFKEAPFQTILDRMQWLSEQTEYMTRLNSYKRAKAELAKQRPDGKATLEDKRLAALEARDASIDFAKAGTSTRKFNRLVMFANAQVQDWAKWGVIGRDYFKGGEAREIALQKIGRLMLTGVLATLLQAALNYSDDDRREKYKRRPDWEKETYWIFADGLRIPKGQDIGTRFVSALTDEFIGKAMDDDPVSAKRILKVIKNAIPSIIPSLIEPVYEVHMNYSSFRDAPIVPVGQQNLDKAEQYGKNTSSFAKLFGELTGWTSPRAVDYLISSYLGSTGKFVSRIQDFITRGATLDDVLMLRRFVFDPNENTKTVKDYYEAYNEQYKHYNTYKLQRKWDRNAKPPSDYDPKLYARLKSISEPLRKISAAENNILRNPKLDWDTKNKKLRELEKKREQLCEKIMRQAR